MSEGSEGPDGVGVERGPGAIDKILDVARRLKEVSRETSQRAGISLAVGTVVLGVLALASHENPNISLESMALATGILTYVSTTHSVDRASTKVDMFGPKKQNNSKEELTPEAASIVRELLKPLDTKSLE